MNYALLGSTGVHVSRLAVGTATFGVAPLQVDVGPLVHRALDRGVNVFDTADSYGNQPRFDRQGAPAASERASAEELLGMALKGRRQRAIISSKVMEPVSEDVNARGLSRRHIMEQVEQSLRRLQTDYLDLYHAHHPDPATPIEETLRAFDDLIRHGKIRYCALSTFGVWRMMDAAWTSDRLGLYAPVCHQIPYNLALRDAEQELFPACERLGVSITAFSPLAGGLLGGTAARSKPGAGRQRWGGPGFSAAQVAVAEQLEQAAAETGFSPTALALQWLLSRAPVAFAIIGPERIEELDAAIDAIEMAVPSETLARIEGIGKPIPRY